MNDSDLLTRLRYLALVGKRLEGGLLARPSVRLPAGGTEISGRRDYSPGDDYRLVDWRISARHDELTVRQYQGEADRFTYLLLDGSRSMTLGEPPKFDAARLAAASLAYLALTRQDRVRLSVFCDRIAADFGPMSDKNQILRLVRWLHSLTAEASQTDLARTAAQFVRRDQRRGLAVVISDFCDPAGFERGLEILRRAGYLPRIVQVCEPRDGDAGLLGDLELVDVESEAARDVIVTERHLAKYRALVARHREQVRRYCAMYSLGYVRLDSALPPERLLLAAIGAQG